MTNMVAALISLSLLSVYILAVSKPIQHKTLGQSNRSGEIDTKKLRGKRHSSRAGHWIIGTVILVLTGYAVQTVSSLLHLLFL
jgi:hypothetical protein